MDLVLGVDGGQTSTKCLLTTTRGQILGRGEGGPLIHLAAQGGRERLVQSLQQALTQAWANAGLAPSPVEAIGLGLTGVEADTAEAHIVLELVPTILQARVVVVQSDAFAALMGAHLGQPGVIAISGTGSVVLGMNGRGQKARAGGWGWLLGDEGSAFAIGRNALLAAFYAFDGVGPATRLEEMFVKHFGVASMYEVKRLLHAPDFGQRGFATLAPLVSRAAEEGDAISAAIIREAGQALAKQVMAVIRRLDFAAAPVAPIGGAFEHVTGLRLAFGAALSAVSDSAMVTDPQLSPAHGAVIIALKECTSDWEQAIAALKSKS